MSATMKETVLKEMCPGCFQSGTSEDNPLRTRPGLFFFYCLRPGSETDRGHEYNDTTELNAELVKVVKLKALRDRNENIKRQEEEAKLKAADKKAPARKPAPPKPKPEPEPEAEELPRTAQGAEAEEEPVSVTEPAAFEVTEMDAARLSELIGAPIRDAATLVGAVYGMRMTGAANAGDEERRRAASMVVESQGIQQTPGGTLSLQVYLPAKTALTVCAKASFNNLPPGDMLQNMLEYIMNGTFFPGGDYPTPPDPYPYDGMYVVVKVPEMYVGTMLGTCEQLGVNPGAYMQSFVQYAIETEQLQ